MERRCQIDHIQRELWSIILEMVSLKDLVQVHQTCHFLHNIAAITIRYRKIWSELSIPGNLRLSDNYYQSLQNYRPKSVIVSKDSLFLKSYYDEFVKPTSCKKKSPVVLFTLTFNEELKSTIVSTPDTVDIQTISRLCRDLRDKSSNKDIINSMTKFALWIDSRYHDTTCKTHTVSFWGSYNGNSEIDMIISGVGKLIISDGFITGMVTDIRSSNGRFRTTKMAVDKGLGHYSEFTSIHSTKRKTDHKLKQILHKSNMKINAIPIECLGLQFSDLFDNDVSIYVDRDALYVRDKASLCKFMKYMAKYGYNHYN